MIGRIRGLLWSRDETGVLIDCNGVGYEVVLPAFVRDALADKEPGDEVQVETYYHVSERNPRPILIGFRKPEERAFFEEFISVSGIGPMTAAKALVMPVSEVAGAIETGDVAALRRLEGIGPRTAEKIVASLRGKVGAYALLQDVVAARRPVPGRVVPLELEREALEVLEQLGYRRAEAMRMIEEALDSDSPPTSAEALIQAIYARQAG